MTSYEFASLILSAVTLIAAVATAVIYFFQLQMMRRQLATMEKSWSWSQKHEVLTSLGNIRDDVERIIALDGKDYLSWGEDDKTSASKICYTMHVLGALLVDQPAVIELFGITWFHSLPRCHRILQPFIDDVRKERDPGFKRYFSAFDYLNAKAEDAIKNYKGFLDK